MALVPIVSCIFTAFKSEEEYANTNVITPPKSWLNFDNFITAWNKANMGEAFLNSFIILICVLAGSIMISAMLAYVLNRFKFPGNKLIRNLFTIATLIPGIASQVTVYQIMTALHLVNSMPGYIILMMGTDVSPSISSCSSSRTFPPRWTKAPFWMAAPTLVCSSRSCCPCSSPPSSPAPS